MEEEVKAGIEKFTQEMKQALPDVQIVVPVRPTGAAFLVSLTHAGVRIYETVHEDDFADWGEGTLTGLADRVSAICARF